MRKPDYWHHGWECVSIFLIGLVVWPWYLKRPGDFFRDAAELYAESKKEFLKP